MWKPGTAAPPSLENVSPKTPQNKKQIQTPKSSNSGKKTKLSGATMGMRFMQRKNNAATEAKRINEEKNKAKAEQAKDEWTIQRRDINDAGDSMDVEEEKPPDKIPQTANSSDMYGISAEIIGRRSFGGFHKSVADTYNDALQSIQYNRVAKKAGKQHISDDELLRRYEKYVKGHSSGSGDASKQKREKRKRV